MRINLLTLGLLGAVTLVNAQYNGTFIGSNGTVTVLDNTFVVNNGSWTVAGSGKGVITGDVMVNRLAATDVVQFDADSDFRLVKSNASTYGQLYIKGYDQAKITGHVVKEYQADYNNGSSGTQQIGLPFHGFTAANLEEAIGSGWMNLTNTALTSSGRFSKASAFVWNKEKARFDQVVTSTVISPTNYYVLPTQSAAGVVSWNPSGAKKDFEGVPAADNNYNSLVLFGAYAGSFGANGNGVNYFREKYNSYIDDPFLDKNETSWANTSTGYARNLYQISNPYLTNLDLSEIGRAGSIDDGNNITNLNGIAYYEGGSVNYIPGEGTTHDKGKTAVIKFLGGVPQGGDVNKSIIKPLGAFMVKLNDANSTTLNFDKLRSFSQTARTTGSGVTSGKSASELSSDQIVKQVAVVLRSADGSEVGRTYYAVSPSLTTGKYEGLGLQSYVDSGYIYTKEENVDGGENTSLTSSLYINEANEITFQGKEVPMYVNFNEAGSYLTFETYEAGNLVDSFENGKSFYIKKDNTLTKIDNNLSLAIQDSYFGLYFEKPEGTLGSSDLSKLNTIVAKKNSDWVVRFAKDWKNANIEVYTAAGQLVHSKKAVSTKYDYVLPLNSSVRAIYLVKVISDNGQEVVKKIVQ